MVGIFYLNHFDSIIGKKYPSFSSAFEQFNFFANQCSILDKMRLRRGKSSNSFSLTNFIS
jgi:hypothetical protein